MKRIYNYESKRMEEVDPTKAEELTSKGEAIKLDMPKLTEYESEAKRLHGEYENKVSKIINDDNPAMTEEVKEYELKKLREQYDADTSELSEDYSAWRAEQIEESRQKAARSFVKVSDKDKQLAEQLASRYTLDIHATGQDAASSIADEIALLSDSERAALQSNISGVLSQIDDKGDKHRIIDAVRQVKNEDAIAYDIAKQLPHDILDEKRRSEIVKDVVHNHPSIFDGGLSFTFDEYKESKK